MKIKTDIRAGKHGKDDPKGHKRHGKDDGPNHA